MPGTMPYVSHLRELFSGTMTMEDKAFFPVLLRYLTDEDQQRLLDEFWEFYRRMIHEKYASLVEHYEEG